MIEEGKGKKRARKWKLIIYFIAGISIILLIAYPALNKIIETKVKEQLKKLAPVAIVNYSSLHADVLSSRISINGLSIKFEPDAPGHYHSFRFSKVELAGINLIQVMLYKNLLINKVKLNQGEIELDQFLLNKKDSLQHDLSSRISFNYTSISSFEINEANVWVYSDQQQKKLLLQGRINIDGLQINPHYSSSAKTIRFNAVQCNVSNIDYSIPSSKQELQIKQLLLDSRKQTVKIDSLKLISEELKAQPTHIEAFISRIAISKFDVSKLEDKQLIAGTIIVDKGDAHIFSRQLPKSDLTPFLNEIKIDSLIITEAAVKLDSKNINRFMIRKIEMTGLNKSFDSTLHYSSFNCSIYDLNYSIPHVYRTLHINSLDADSKKRLLKITDVKIATQYPKFEYGKKLGRQADYIQATIPLIKISDIDYKQLLQKRLVANKIIVDKSDIYFFRDRRLPRQLKEQPMPNGYLKEIPLEVRVNTFEINDASVVSEEFPKTGNESGYLAIYNINISMSPMLNRPAKNDPGYSNTYVEGSIMNAGLIKATIRAPLRKNVYFIKGDIKNLDLPKLNPSAENLGRFHIESGILNSLNFQFTATEEKANGEIVGEYHDLLIDRLKQKKGEKRIAKVPTFFLKHVIIPKNKDKSLNVKKRTGKIEYNRDPTRMVSFYFLKSLLNGIRASFTFGFLLPE